MIYWPGPSKHNQWLDIKTEVMYSGRRYELSLVLLWKGNVGGCSGASKHAGSNKGKIGERSNTSKRTDSNKSSASIRGERNEYQERKGRELGANGRGRRCFPSTWGRSRGKALDSPASHVLQLLG